MTDRSCLLRALQDMGFTEGQIRVNETAQQLQGYGGDMRADTAEIILPRAHVGGASNDIGFKLNEDGTYGAIISDYDRGNGASSKHGSKSEGIHGYSDKWLKKLTQRYTYQKLKDQCADQGFFIESESEENGELIIEINADQFS